MEHGQVLAAARTRRRLRPEDYDRARELFHELCELSAGARGDAFDRSGASAEVRAEVESLLEVFDQGKPLAEGDTGGIGQFLVENVAGADQESAGALGHPERIGSYTVVGRLGEGGMGIVYRGQQENPRREVAIKVLRGLVGETELRRFEYEAEILGRLDHPFVAKVIEAGIEPALNGLPYIVMELVSGEDLLTYCEARIPNGPAGRSALLELFADVCEGVEHAHQHGIVHRDLKPGNVLVSAEGRPRILDFGIARPADLGEADASTPGRTRTGSVVGTLAWMSPEQARGDRDAMDVRSDVYSLGVILYRLTTGEMPYDVADLPPWEAARKICEDEPRRLGRGDSSLRGDLEAIAAMALEKEPGERYAGAGALGREVRRLLALQPVEGRPWSTTYQVAKFARRHWLLVSPATALLLSLVSGLVTGLVLWRQAEGFAEDARDQARLVDEAREAESTRAAELERVVTNQVAMITSTDLAHMGAGIRRDVLANAGEALARERAPPAERDAQLATYGVLMDQADQEAVASFVVKRSLLAPGRAAVGIQFADQPLIRAQLLRRLGEAHVGLGFHLEALECFREALEVEEELGSKHPEVLELRVELALQQTKTRTPAESLAVFGELRDDVVTVLGMDNRLTGRLFHGLASSYANMGRIDEACVAFEQAIGATQAWSPDRPQEVFALRRSLARSLYMGNRADEDEVILTGLVGQHRGEIEAGDLQALRMLTDYGTVFIVKQDYAEAEAILSEAVERLRASVGGKHVVTLVTLDQLGVSLRGLGRLEEAAVIWRESINARRQMWPQGGAYLCKALADLSLVLHELGEPEEALDPAREAVDLAVDSLPGGSQARGIAERALAELEAALAE